MKSTFLFISFMLISLTKAQVNMGIVIGGNKPVGDFGSAIKNKPFANIGLAMGYMPNEFPKIEIGAFVGAGMYAYKEYTHTFKNTKNETEQVEVYEDDCFFQFSITGKYFPLKPSRINPYVGAQFGVNRFFSHIDPMETETETSFKSKMVWHGTGLQTGINLGVKLYLTKEVVKDKIGGLYLTLDQSFLYGSTTKYRYFESDPETLKGNLNLGIQNTNTSMWRSSLAFGLEF